MINSIKGKGEKMNINSLIDAEMPIWIDYAGAYIRAIPTSRRGHTVTLTLCKNGREHAVEMSLDTLNNIRLRGAGARYYY